MALSGLHRCFLKGTVLPACHAARARGHASAAPSAFPTTGSLGSFLSPRQARLSRAQPSRRAHSTALPAASGDASAGLAAAGGTEAAASLQLLNALLGSCTYEEARSRLQARELSVRDSKSRPDLYTVSYRDIMSDFGDPIARLARGLVLEKGTNAVVCFPFTKFFNSGEKHAADFPGSTPSADAFRWGDGCVVTEKLDGSLMKVYHWKGEWVVATNRTIDARDADLPTADYSAPAVSFVTLFREAVLATTGLPTLPFAQMDPRCTYLFELAHPAVQTVVAHARPRLTHLGTRLVCSPDYPELPLWPSSDGTGAAAHRVPGVPVPMRYPALAASSALIRAAALDLTSALAAEGFVACDAAFRRLKIKSPAYVMAHASSLSAQGGYDDEALIGAITSGGADDLVTLFPLFPRLEAHVGRVTASIRYALTLWLAALSRLSAACPSGLDDKARFRTWALEAQKISKEAGGVPFALTIPFKAAGVSERMDRGALTEWVRDRRKHLGPGQCKELVVFIMRDAP